MPTKPEADLLKLMRVDQAELEPRQAAQDSVDREATGETIPAVSVKRATPRRPLTRFEV
jgi:hypothetical protein